MSVNRTSTPSVTSRSDRALRRRQGHGLSHSGRDSPEVSRQNSMALKMFARPWRYRRRKNSAASACSKPALHGDEGRIVERSVLETTRISRSALDSRSTSCRCAINEAGGILLLAHNWADWPATKRSYELMARYVHPHFQRNSNELRDSSYDDAKSKYTTAGLQSKAAVQAAIDTYQRRNG
jgi:hypothetical protein